MIARKTYRVAFEQQASSADGCPSRRECVPADHPEANVFSSELADGSGLHAPVLDLDLPCELVPSTTPGHFHLYVEAPMSWDVYCTLLVAMKDAGVLEPGYVDASIEQGATFVRMPGVRKESAS